MNVSLAVSKLVPVPMRSTYSVGISGTYDPASSPSVLPEMPVETARWWQWRGRVFRHRVSRRA